MKNSTLYIGTKPINIILSASPFTHCSYMEWHLRFDGFAMFICLMPATPVHVLFLGTHRDKLQECETETVEEKNKRVEKLILATFTKQVIWFNSEKLIFEMNALNPNDNDKRLQRGFDATS